MKNYDKYELLAAFILGAAVIAIISTILFDLRDKEACKLKGGLYIHETCFKKEAVYVQ